MADVLIFDDDPSIGDLLGEVLRAQSLTVTHHQSGAGVLQIVQEQRPRLVVLDIMMPGVDGLTACRTLRANPATRAVKIIVLTAKDFRQDKAAAEKYGADLFIRKPFDPREMALTIGKLMGSVPPVSSAPAPPTAPVVVSAMGGSTIVETPGLWLIFDAGPGLKAWLQRQTQAPNACWVFLSRYQDDAIAELSWAAMVVAAGSRVSLAGPDDSENCLQRLAPRLCADVAGKGRLTPLLYPQREGEFILGPGMRVVTVYTQHPGSALAYRLELHGKRFIYCPAHEVNPDVTGAIRHEREKFRRFFSEADLLVHGYRRSQEDPVVDDGRGRGAWEPMVDLAREAAVKRLGLLPLPGAPVDGVAALAVARAGGAPACAVLKPGEALVL